MPKLKAPLLSLGAVGRLAKHFSLTRRRKQNILEKRPIPTDAKSPTQLFYRHMFTKCIDLWHLLSSAEKQAWESAARPKHMTGYAWYISQCLRPNPGIYLPLQGGTMSGNIDMDKNRMLKLPEPVDGQEADTKDARDAAIAAALADPFDVHLFGYDGANWQNLLVESAANKNLRVILFNGAYAIEAHNQDGDWRVPGVQGLNTAAYNYGFSGSYWQRLRTYNTGILKVGRAEIDSTTVRYAAIGAVISGARKLFWVACSPDAPGAEWELSDDLDGSTAAVYDHFDNDKHSEHLIFDPPMKFSTGIYIKKFDHMHSLTFCYI